MLYQFQFVNTLNEGFISQKECKSRVFIVFEINDVDKSHHRC